MFAFLPVKDGQEGEFASGRGILPFIRALGPGSVSSFLKVILDVFYVFLWSMAGFLALLIFGALLVSFDPRIIPPDILQHIQFEGHESFASGTLMITAGEIEVVLVMVIVQRLRKIFGAMTAGDPFHPENVRRLRVVGLFLALLELSRYGFGAVHQFALHEAWPESDDFNLTAWFAVLVVFVLAEVFREGARLRREAALTI